MSQFIQGEAFAGFRNVKNTKFGSEGFWPNLLRIIGWGYAAVTILDVLISLFSGVIYSPAGVLRNLLSGLVDAVLWLTICMVIANIADDIDATRKNSDQARENAAANTPKSAG
jgi:hypothetical protein